MNHILKYLVFTSLFLLLFSCKNDNNQIVKSGSIEKEISTETDSGLPIPDLYKGMAESDANSLGGLTIGEQAPNIVATFSNGDIFNMKQELQKGPIAIVFYRGHWCGICTKHLAELSNHSGEMLERNLSVVVVTPESNKYIDQTKEKSNMPFPAIHDADLSIMKNYKVAYQVTAEYAEKVGGYTDASLAETQGQEQAFLPVPATFLIGQDGKVHYAHYDHNYGKRAEAQDLLDALASLN